MSEQIVLHNGELFPNLTIEAVGGPRAIDVCWTSPTMLPSIDEIRNPQQWLRRIDRHAA